MRLQFPLCKNFRDHSVLATIAVYAVILLLCLGALILIEYLTDSVWPEWATKTTFIAAFMIITGLVAFLWGGYEKDPEG